LLGSPVGWGRRIAHLLLAMIILIGVSFSWIVVVDLVPASQRPYVGSSQTNSELELALGYNGVQRLLGMRFGGRGGGGGAGTRNNQPADGQRANGSPANGSTQPAQPPQNPPGGFGGGPGGFGTGNPSPLRLFNSSLGGQISWLLPLAIIGFFAAAWAVSRSKAIFPLNRQQKSLLMWGVWLLTTGVFFSVAGFFHPYYMVMMAPAIAALVGIGVVAMWQQYRGGGWPGLLLPVSLLVTVAAQASLLSSYQTFSSVLTPVIVILCGLASLGLIAFLLIARRQPSVTNDVETYKIRETRGAGVMSRFAVMLGMLSLLIVPAVWSGVSVLQGGGGGLPSAGPANFGPFGGRVPGGANGSRNGARNADRTGSRNGSALGFGAGRGGADPFSQTDSRLEQYLLAHQGNTKFLLATANANSAAPIILSTGKAVMAMGGFSGSDPILTQEKLAGLVQSGVVRYFLVQGTGGFGGPGGFGGRNGLTSWITSNCQVVPASDWQSQTQSTSGTGGFRSSQQLYSCTAQ
jgi:4-amino-4-deoxy-L-arabinose transferase-like glycosyltransferase